jgi:hypothetical protein
VAGREFETRVLNPLWCPSTNLSRGNKGFAGKADHLRPAIVHIKNRWSPNLFRHSLGIVNYLLGLSENLCFFRGGHGDLSIGQCVVSSPATCPAFCVIKLFNSD